MKFLEAEKVDEKTAERLEKLIEKSYYSYWKKKRIFDVVVTLILLIFLIIPILITALVVFIDDPNGTESPLICINSVRCMWTPKSAKRSSWKATKWTDRFLK